MNTTAAPVRRYEAGRLHRLGVRVYGPMVRELFGARELLFRMVWRDLKLRTRVSFLGMGWSLLQPLGLMLIFLFLRHANVLDVGEDRVPYALFAFAGLIHWHWFASMLTKSASSLVGAAPLVSKVAFPREVLVLTSIAVATFDYLCALALLAALFAVCGVMPLATACLLPLAVLPLLATGIALGLLAGLVALPVRDIALGLPLILPPLMFLTPVLYEFPATGWWPYLRTLNPVAVVIDTVRDTLFFGTWRDPVAWSVWLVVSLLMLVMAWRLFYLAMPRVPEYA